MSYRVFSVRVLRLLFLKALGFTGLVPCLLISLRVYVHLYYYVSNIGLILFGGGPEVDSDFGLYRSYLLAIVSSYAVKLFDVR